MIRFEKNVPRTHPSNLALWFPTLYMPARQPEGRKMHGQCPKWKFFSRQTNLKNLTRVESIEFFCNIRLSLKFWYGFAVNPVRYKRFSSSFFSTISFSHYFLANVKKYLFLTKLKLPKKELLSCKLNLF